MKVSRKLFSNFDKRTYSLYGLRCQNTLKIKFEKPIITEKTPKLISLSITSHSIAQEQIKINLVRRSASI